MKKGKDPTGFVVLFEDSAAMLGLVVAFLGVLMTHITGNLVFDGLASIAIGLILGGTAIWLAYETKGLLIGESANLAVVQEIKTLTRNYPFVEHVNEVLTMHMGPKFILANLSVDFKDEVRASELEAAISGLDKLIKQNCPDVKRVFVEAEARTSASPDSRA